jgi:hypothetical protein
MSRHFTELTVLLQRGPVLVVSRHYPPVIAISAHDYSKLVAGTGLSAIKRRRYRALALALRENGSV